MNSLPHSPIRVLAPTCPVDNKVSQTDRPSLGRDQGRQPVSYIVRVQTLSPPLLSSPLPSPPLPLEVGPLNQAGVWGSAVSSPSGVWAKPQPASIWVHFQGEGTLLMAFKMHDLKHQKSAFLYVSQITVKSNQIQIVHLYGAC